MKFYKMIVFLAVSFFCGSVFGDFILLKQGQRMTGEILADKEDKLVFDIGVDVLVINKQQVMEYEYTSGFEMAAEDADSNSFEVGGDLLYHCVKVAKAPIEEVVERVSEAVVMVSSPGGMGSGFFINEQGYLITNYHVVERETKLEVTVFQKHNSSLEKQKFKKVKIIALNPFIDLALLKVEDIGDYKISYVYLGDVSDIKVGEKVFAIGNPLGLERTVTDGVVSTINRAFEGLVYIQTNADINPGNSGGPLFNLGGEVVGVTNMGYIFFGGLGFAIPINYVKHFIENRDAFAYDKDNPNTGFRYIQPDGRLNKNDPEFTKGSD